MKSPIRILHLEDNPHDAELIASILGRENVACQRTVVQTESQFQEALAQSHFDLILSDYSLPGYNGLSALCFARRKHPHIPFLFVSGTIGEEAAIEILKKGATDYVLKERLTRLAPALHRALKEAAEQSEKERIEAQLKEKAALLDLTQDAIIVHNLEGGIRYWNKGAELLYGWNKEQALGQRISDLLFDQKQQGHWEKVVALALANGHWRGELNERSKDNRKLMAEARLTIIRDAEGQPRSMLFLNTDITEKKLLEKQFLRAQRLECVGILAAGIAHDLNNVLAPILMAAHLLPDQFQDPETKRMIATIQTSALRGADIVRQVLAFARGLDGDRLLVQTKHLIKELLRLVRQTFPESIQIQTRLANSAWPILADPTQIHQVLLNLCLNARDAMPEGGLLKIELDNVELDEAKAKKILGATPGHFVCFRVRDTGLGIPQDIILKIFEPFFTTKAPGKGTGLGLSTSFGIVKSHGGCIQVDSEVNQGTTFEVYLPANRDSSQPVESEDKILPHGQGELVLVVDDDPAIREMTKTILGLHGYRIVVAASGREAVSMFPERHHEIHVVITDCGMPGMDGFEVFKAWRGIAPDKKIILSSGQDQKARLDKVQDANLMFLQKPWTAEKLLLALDALLHAP